MKKSQAIGVLEKHRDKLSKRENHNITWSVQTIAYIKQLIEGSENRIKLIEHAGWTTRYHEDIAPLMTNLSNDGIEEKNIKEFKPIKLNLLQRLSDTWVILIVATLVSTAFGINR